jgi:hypothetical protein
MTSVIRNTQPDSDVGTPVKADNVMLQTPKIPFVFTERHAYPAAQFYSDLALLDQIDWTILQKRDFKLDDKDPTKGERYQAEALVHRHLPIDALLGMACYTPSVAACLKSHVATRGLSIPVAAKDAWYFT